MKLFATLRNFYFYKIDILINLVLLCFAGQKQNRGCYRVLYQESMTELPLHIKALFQSSVRCWKGSELGSKGGWVNR